MIMTDSVLFCSYLPVQIRRLNDFISFLLFRTYSPIQVHRLNDFILFLLFWSYSSVFWSSSTVNVRRCDFSVMFYH